MVSTVSRAWSRTGDHRSVQQAHSDLVEQIERVGGRGIYPVTEGAVAQMCDEVARLTAKPVPPDPAARAAQSEFHEAVRRYQRLHFDLVERSKKLYALRGNAVHQLLADVPDDVPIADTQAMVDACFGKQVRAYSVPGEILTPTWAHAHEWGAASLKVQAAVQRLSALAARIEEPLRFEVYPTDQQNRLLVLALADQLAALRNRVTELEDRINQLEQPARATRSQRR